MSREQWRTLLLDHLSGRLDAKSFHDSFLARWRAARDAGVALPGEIDDLFFAVENVCPDPALREPGDADETQLAAAVRQALLQF